jgi:deoxycytidine triphosphate deaminase
MVHGGGEGSFKASSYDLRIDCVIDSKGVRHVDQYVLKPQEVAWIVSREILQMPLNVTATAHIKTTLCNDGLLALNTGIIDPRWHGPLSTPILNFGKGPHILRGGDEFLRLTFHRHKEEDVPASGMERSKYIADKQNRAVRYFGEKFLDSNSILKEALNNNLFKYAGLIGIALAIFVAMVGAVLTLGAIFVNSSAFYGPSYYSSYFSKAVDVGDREKALEKRIDDLEQLLRKTQPSAK